MRRGRGCAGGSRGCRRASERVLEWGGQGFRVARAPPSSEPASPSAERSGGTDLLSGVRYLHTTCPFVNLVSQLLASLHLYLPVPRTLQAPAPLLATPAAYRAPPLTPSLLAHPPLRAPCHVGLGGCSAPGSFSSSSVSPVLLVLFLRLLLLLFIQLGNPGRRRLLRGALPESAGLTASVPLHRDCEEPAKKSPTCSPPLPGSSALHRMGVENEKKKKNVQTAWMLG